ncbi:hypothetical protein RA19_18370 [Leisingera sp. ANG-M1]|nr:hypothetical protein RA19_18370 [Leisingera sp. ANG-M1]
MLLRCAVLGVATALLPSTAADAYPVDCAILLCLAGGWPASAECSHAKAVFIRRITPWPVEPPLQIWRCPMKAATNQRPAIAPLARLHEAEFFQELEARGFARLVYQKEGAARSLEDMRLAVSAKLAAGADVDISDPAFEFVRSLRVFHMDFRQTKEPGYCERRDSSRLGTYGLQGDFLWQGHSLRSARRVPTSDNDRGGPQFTVTTSWNAPSQSAIHQMRAGGECRALRFRAVGVSWEDFEGNPGYEEVRY